MGEIVKFPRGETPERVSQAKVWGWCLLAVAWFVGLVLFTLWCQCGPLGWME